jgi:hypothetical protein
MDMDMDILFLGAKVSPKASVTAYEYVPHQLLDVGRSKTNSTRQDRHDSAIKTDPTMLHVCFTP